VKKLRRTLSEASAAVLVELRGLFPEARPLSSEEVLAALRPGDLILNYLFGADTAVLVTAGGGVTSGAVLAEKKEGLEALRDLAQRLRASIAERPLSSSVGPDAQAARELLLRLLPEKVRALALNGRRLVVLPDGPLHDLPFEVLLAFAHEEALREIPVVYAASATVYLQRLKAAQEAKKAGSGALTALILGDPIYERDPVPECAFRTKPATNSDGSRPLIPEQSGHPFRSIPATDSDRSRPLFNSSRIGVVAAG
jgi:hypothetical protein